MNSNKCMTCGLANAATLSVCGRCGSALSHQSGAFRTGTSLGSTHASRLNQHGFIAEQIRGANKRLLAANVVLLAALLAVSALSARYLYNFCAGPFALSDETLTSLKNADNLNGYFVKVRIDNIVDYGVQEIKKERRGGRETVLAEYYALILGEKLLLVKTSPEHRASEFIGSLEDLSTAAEGEVIGRFLQNDPGAKGAFLPVMLDATGFRGPGYVGLAIGVPLLLLSVWNIRKALQRRANPEEHPIFSMLSRYGGPETVAAAIDAEVSASGKKLRDRVLVTPSWLLKPSPYSLAVRSLDELVWAYKKVTKHSVNFIPTGKTYATVIWDRRGKSIEITNAREQDGHLLLEEIGRHAPWVLIGYADDLARAWKSNAAEVVSAVDKQRRNEAKKTEPSSQPV